METIIINFENVSLTQKTGVLREIPTPRIPRIPDFMFEVAGNSLGDKLKKFAAEKKEIVKVIVLESGITITIKILVDSPDSTKKTLASMLKTLFASSSSSSISNQTIFIPILSEWVTITDPNPMALGWEFS